jgi:uncharacterized protein (DUF2235 family)
MSRPRSRSRTNSYEETTQYKLVTTAEPISRTRSRSRGRTYESDERIVRTHSRSRPPPPKDTSGNCIPCSLVAPSSTLRKRLIVCCDGTFCAVDKGTRDGGLNPTNIARLSRAIANVGLDSDNRPIIQIVNYQSGVGTGHLTKAGKALQGAFGDGLNEKVCEAYTFLVNNYGPGDEIFIFGFSRGKNIPTCMSQLPWTNR